MLQITNLTITHTRDLTVLIEDLSFSVNPGERIALIGEEGNGKSTLLRAVAGDMDICAFVQVDGKIVNTYKTAFLPQELPQRERALTAYEFFCENDRFFDVTPGELGEMASRLGIPEASFYSDQPMGAFSGGERVKLQIARMMMDSPELLLLDEPTNDLDMGTVRWLEDFLVSCGLTVLFVSHDETLLSRAATGVLLIERLRRRTVPRAGLSRIGYDAFVSSRADLFAHQTQVARKERAEHEIKMRKYEQIRQKVEHQQNVISRRDPAGSRLLKKKMHAVQSVGRRFEREAENMTAMPEAEEAIFARLGCVPLPPSKVVLDLNLDELRTQDGVLSRRLRLTVCAGDKLCITGKNGAGKSTLLRLIRDRLKERTDLHVFYMPQDPDDLLDMDRTPVEFLTREGGKEENVRICVALGSMKFTQEEMHHACRGLSGGQKAKLMFLAMAQSNADVLLLDEPTRNLSPLSGPVIRELLRGYPGCIIAVSHDMRFIREVCSRSAELRPDGIHSTDFDVF